MTAETIAPPALEVRDLVVHYGPKRRRGRTEPAVDGVSFDIGPGETVGLVGESGSGKSTIGKAILGLQPPTSGTIRLNGRDITHMPLRERRSVIADLRVVFQDPYSSLNPAQTIGETLIEPLRILGVGKADGWRRAGETLWSVGLTADALHHYPDQFSGGQRQRIAVARALVCQPRVVVLDEPVSALDLSTQAQVLNLLADLRDQHQYSFLFVAHDLGVVRFLAQRAVVLYRGQIMEAGPVDAVTERPKHPYTAALTASAPVPRPAEQAQRREAREALGVGAAGAAAPSLTGCPFATRCPAADELTRTERPALRLLGESLVACHHATSDGPPEPLGATPG
ncbi:oligopeptide/dipeptide ABC transporter ATP-binding protein [Haloechinothrix halophila]|uniref:oligopeptide/dipeptide ABC transporter ATP-binding protein n=1 Tax=Haloechinothrix halophila TaxID=1069073 RepID=UPI0004242523|nr:oligopeptide/dipeptide ABC transporter ATP-binding protein [Haloechinothrix halophila]